MFSRRNLIIAAAVLITLANAGVLGYALTSKKTAQVKNTTTNVISKKADIKNSEQVTVNSTQKGQLLGTGQYAYESLDQSKITQGDTAQLVVAEEQQSGSHFVLALLGQNTKIPADKINNGWTVNTIAQDRMWAPGACSSKPTYLLQGKYIFIDDGKTNSDDKFNSYIVFDMASGKYHYFGGSNFSKEQGNNEVILKAVDENDKLVFYIDPVDSKGPLTGNTEGKHSLGSDHGYIIRREIDPATLKYTDYSLPYTAPNGINVYTITWGYNYNSLISLAADGSVTNFDGQVADNRINFKQASNSYVTPPAPPLESALELKLKGALVNALPNLSKQTPYNGAAQYTTKYGLTELGDNQSVKFLIATQRFDSYSTPTVYNENSNHVNPMTDSQMLQQYTNYVALGVF